MRDREAESQAKLAQSTAKLDWSRRQVQVLEDQLRQNSVEASQSKVDSKGRVSQAQAELAAAEADLAQQEAAYKLALFDKDAYMKLAQSGAVSERQGKQAETTAETQAALVAASKRRVEAARGALTAAEATTSNSDIRNMQAATLRQQIAQQQADIASAAADEQRARADLLEAKANRQDLTVTAPFDGTVVTRTAEPGEVLTAGTPVSVTLLDLHKIYLRGYIPERQIGRGQGGPGGAGLPGFESQPACGSGGSAYRSAGHLHAGEYLLPRRPREAGRRREAGVKERIRLRQTRHAGRWRGAGGGRYVAGGKPSQMTGDRQGGAVALAEPTQTGAPDRVAIRTRDLRKNYGPVEAVRGIELEVHDGEIFGLIGPDGAGKTTTFQILAGIMEASSGLVEVFGKPARESRAVVGYLTQTFSLYPDLSVNENIRYVGDLRHVPPEEIAQQGDRYLQMFDMDRFKQRLAGKLSGGMKQKLSLACALVAQPRVLLLDEPTTGVDPVSRREFWDTLAHLAADGLTIVVATPYLDEAERCHTVALMHLGEIHQTGSPAELRDSLGMRRLEVHTDHLAEAEDKLTEAEGNVIGDVQRFGDRLDVIVKDPAAGRAAVEGTLAKAGIAIRDVRVADPTLENTFVARLRAMGQELHAPPFPGKHAHRDLKGQVAIGAENLTKRFVSFTAVLYVNLNVR